MGSCCEVWFSLCMMGLVFMGIVIWGYMLFLGSVFGFFVLRIFFKDFWEYLSFEVILSFFESIV